MENSEEVEWVSSIKPLLTASYSNFNKQYVPNLIRTVQKSEKGLEECNKEFEPFYSTFAALSTHYVCNNVNSFKSSDLTNVSSTCRILMKYLLKKLQIQSSVNSVSQKHLMLLLKSMCKGSSSLSKSDVVTYTALLKQAKLPPSVKTGDQENDSSEDSREIKRPRLDTGKDIFSQLTSVIEETNLSSSSGGSKVKEIISSDGDTTISHISDPAEQIKALFASRNMMTLQQLNGGDILLDVCTELPYLKRYHNYFENAMMGKGLHTPSIMSEAISVRSSLQSVVNDLSIVSRVFSLPILEPLTIPRLTKVIKIAMACLHAACSAAVATSIVEIATGASHATVKIPGSNKDDDVDTFAMMTMHRALEILTCVQNAIQQSTRTGGSQLRNLQVLAVWTELVTLQKILNFTPISVIEKTPIDSGASSAATSKSTGVSSDAASRSGSGSAATASGGISATATVTSVVSSHIDGSKKGNAMIGVLGVALASHAVKLLNFLMNDLQEENIPFQVNQMETQTEKFLIDIQKEYTAQERMKFLTSDVDIASLLLDIMKVTFNKAILLRSPNKSTVSALEELSVEDMEDSSSDSNTYYEDDFSSSDHSTDEDEDSEPILGQLFAEDLGIAELPPPPPAPTRPEVNKHKPSRLNSNEFVSALPDRRDPQGYITIATDILHFFNTHLMSGGMNPANEAAGLFQITKKKKVPTATLR